MPPSQYLPGLLDLRGHAKALLHRAKETDGEAVGRFMASHPVYSDGSPDRLDLERLTLGDAQLVVAIEHGHGSWAEVVAEAARRAGGGPTARWNPSASSALTRRTMTEAKQLRHPVAGDLHLLLAVLAPGLDTAARAVLVELGADYEEARRTFRPWAHGDPDKTGVTGNPRLLQVVGVAEGLALAAGAPVVSDETALTALAYTSVHSSGPLPWLDLDPDEVVEALRAHSLAVPELLPPSPEVPAGPQGPAVYYPAADAHAVLAALDQRIPRGSARWGFNVSTWKAGYHMVMGQDTLPLEDIVRGAVTDQSTVTAMPMEQVRRNEGWAPA